MEQERMVDMIQSFMVSATQLAYVEEAHGTLALLEDANEVFRYIFNNVQTVTLFNEVEIFNRYQKITRVRYGDRFTVSFANQNSYKSVYIPHLSVVGIFDSIYKLILDQNETCIDLFAEVEMNIDANTLTVKVVTEKHEPFYHKEIDFI